MNAAACAHLLHSHPKVDTVYYPGLTSHPGHEIAKKQMRGFGGMIAFEMKGGLEAAKKMVQVLNVMEKVSYHAIVSLKTRPRL